MIIPLVLAFLMILLTGIGQVLLKIGARSGEKSGRFFKPYLNPSTFTAYGFFFMVTVISIYLLEEIPLKLLIAISSLNILVVVGLSWILLRESITKQHLIAIVLIICGLAIFNF